MAKESPCPIRRARQSPRERPAQGLHARGGFKRYCCFQEEWGQKPHGKGFPEAYISTAAPTAIWLYSLQNGPSWDSIFHPHENLWVLQSKIRTLAARCERWDGDWHVFTRILSLSAALQCAFNRETLLCCYRPAGHGPRPTVSPGNAGVRGRGPDGASLPGEQTPGASLC